MLFKHNKFILFFIYKIFKNNKFTKVRHTVYAIVYYIPVFRYYIPIFLYVHTPK